MVTTSHPSPLTDLLSRLGVVGVPAKFARTVLPSWWDDAIARSPSGLQQAQMYFSRAFRIDLSSLADVHAPVQFQPSQRKFKLSRNVAESDVSISAHFATAIANLALVGFSSVQKAVPKDPGELRAAILQNHDCVNLSALLSWCNEVGIPVMHIYNLPGKKMTGLVVRENNRFAIVLSKKGSPSHLLFHLAHELGHIANGHLKNNGFVVDEKIGGTDEGDADEKEADAYAIRLLNGREVAYKQGGSISNSKALYNAALQKATQERIDVGHIILNFGHSQGNYSLANSAMKFIPGETDGIKVVNKQFFQALDVDKLSDDQLELLKMATNYSK